MSDATIGSRNRLGGAVAVAVRRPDIRAAEHELRRRLRQHRCGARPVVPDDSTHRVRRYGEWRVVRAVRCWLWRVECRPASHDLPIFNAGRNRATVRVAEVDRDLAVTAYERAVEVAF